VHSEGLENLALDVIGEGLVYRATQRQTEDAVADVGILPPGSWLIVVFSTVEELPGGASPKGPFQECLVFHR
jgi:hypothetical protein